MSCKGEEIDFQDLRTPEQKAVMGELASRIMGGLEVGATPFPGQLSAPPDQGQMQAMNIMTNLPYIMSGGQQPFQPYSFGPFPMGGQPPIAMPPEVPFHYYDNENYGGDDKKKKIKKEELTPYWGKKRKRKTVPKKGIRP